MQKQIEQLIAWIEKNERQVSSFIGGSLVVVVFMVGYQLLLSEKLKFAGGPNIEVELAEEEEPTKRTHVVQVGEGLASLAELYYGDQELWPQIAKANNMTEPYLIEIGQELVIPVIEGHMVTKIETGASEPSAAPTDTEEAKDIPGTYTVKKGDYLARISIDVYGNSDRWIDILNANRDKIKNPEILEKGMVLVLPE